MMSIVTLPWLSKFLKDFSPSHHCFLLALIVAMDLKYGIAKRSVVKSNHQLFSKAKAANQGTNQFDSKCNRSLVCSYLDDKNILTEITFSMSKLQLIYWQKVLNFVWSEMLVTF